MSDVTVALSRCIQAQPTEISTLAKIPTGNIIVCDGPSHLRTLSSVLIRRPIKALALTSFAARRTVYFTYGEWTWRCNGCVAQTRVSIRLVLNPERSLAAVDRKADVGHVVIFRLNFKVLLFSLGQTVALRLWQSFSCKAVNKSTNHYRTFLLRRENAWLWKLFYIS